MTSGSDGGMPEQEIQDKVMPEGKWAFDEQVTACFDTMLANSIPSYDVMRDMTFGLGKRFVQSGTTVIDLGASRGNAIAPFVDAFKDQPVSFVACEVSEPMLKVLRDRFKDLRQVAVYDDDLREPKFVFSNKASLVLSILTIQFTPIEYRLDILEKIYECLEPGGAFIFVEKVLGANSRLNKLFIDEYYAMKNGNGYSQDAIARKRASLEGVLVPMTANWNEEMLKTTGFRHVDCFYRHLNFAGWICIK